MALPSIKTVDLQFTADLKVQGFNDKTIRVKIYNPQFIANNSRIGLTEAAKIFENSNLESSNRAQTAHAFTTYITVPVILQLKKGQVKSLITARGEPSSVTKIKQQIALELEENKPSTHLQLMKRQQIFHVLQTPFAPKTVKVRTNIISFLLVFYSFFRFT